MAAAPALAPDDYYTPTQLAEVAGVTSSSITSAMRRALKPAVLNRHISKRHPLVQAYIAKHRARPAHLKGTRGAPGDVEAPESVQSLAQGPTLPCMPSESAPVPVAPGDPLAFAASMARRVPSNSRDRYTGAFLYNLQTQTAGALPDDIEDLGQLTLREVIDRAGSFEALLTAVKSLKTHAEYRKVDIEAKRRRGTLIDRAAVERTVFPYINLTQKRIVSEMPKAVAERIIARVLTGGESLALDVEKLIRDECTSVFRSCKETTVKALAVFDG